MKNKLMNKKVRKDVTLKRKGKTYEEIYGIEKSKLIKKRLSKNSFFKSLNKNRIGKNFEQIYGEEKAIGIKNKLSRLRKGIPKSDKTKKNMRTFWINMDLNKKNNLLKKMMKAKKLKISKNEIILNSIIKKNNLPFNYVGNGKIWIEGFNPDFLSKNPKHIIELYGNRHLYEKKSQIRDKRRLKAYSKFGYKTLIIKNSELNNKNKVLNKIKEFIK